MNPELEEFRIISDDIAARHPGARLGHPIETKIRPLADENGIGAVITAEDLVTRVVLGTFFPGKAEETEAENTQLPSQDTGN